MVTYGKTATETKGEEMTLLTSADSHSIIDHEAQNHLNHRQQYEIDPDDLKIQNEILGSGHFGDVQVGLLRESDGKQVTVAVKKTKSSTDPGLSAAQRADQFRQGHLTLQRELSIMLIIGPHPNVLALKGAITNRDDFCVVTEYCEYGSLDKFLSAKEKQGKFVSEYIVKSSDGYQLTKLEFNWKNEIESSWAADFEFRRKDGIVTTSDLMWFGWQIAEALEFLMSKKVLHRDIALRNILLATGYVVKVADFGLSRETDGSVYQSTNPTEMPIGYLAPEVLQYSQYSPKSESWAFAILLWELFMLASRQPYVFECGPGIVDKATISAFLGADKRLPMPENAPFSIRKLIALLWSREPAGRPDFRTSQMLIMEDLKIANPKLAAIAQEMSNLNCGNSSSGSIDSLVTPYQLFDNKQLRIQDKPSPKSVSKLLKVLSTALIFTTAFFAILIYTLLKTTEQPKLQAARWSWSFNASDVYNAKLKHIYYGTPGELDLGPQCGVLKWRPFMRRMQNNETLTEFPFFLEYITGSQKLPVRAWRSMVLMTDDGREIMQGNDFHRNGYLYNKSSSSDNNAWASNSTFLTNTSDNDPFTLKIEVFVDPTWVGCNAEKPSPKTPINYEEECNRLSTNTKLYFNGSCYVGSNTKTQFQYAIQLCNDIPSAAISRLAWIESEELLEKLRETFVIHTRNGRRINEPYFIGAKQSLDENDMRSDPNNNWYWIDSNENPKKPFPSNFSLWTNDEPNDDLNEDERYAAVFYGRKNLSDVVESKWFRYLCEYRDADK